MTECNHQPLFFSCLSSHKVVADFDGGQLSSVDGAVLLREADLQLGHREARLVTSQIQETRAGSDTRPKPCSPSGTMASPWGTRI